MSVYCNDNGGNETDIRISAEDFIKASCANMIPPEKAAVRELAGVRLFGRPSVGYASADDPTFSGIGDADGTMPKEWLTSAETVVTVFLPFTDELKESVRKNFNMETSEWMQGRTEGERCVSTLMKKIKAQLISEGYEAVIPDTEYPGASSHNLQPKRRWSCSHAARACGIDDLSHINGMVTEEGYIGGLITSKRIES